MTNTLVSKGIAILQGPLFFVASNLGIVRCKGNIGGEEDRNGGRCSERLHRGQFLLLRVGDIGVDKDSRSSEQRENKSVGEPIM